MVMHILITLGYLVCNIKLHTPEDDKPCEVISQATYVVIDNIW
jgi:hypothetical protein